MRPIRLFLLLSFLFVLFRGFVFSQELYLTSTNYPPYFGKNLKNNGFIAEIISESFKRSGISLRIDFFPWARSQMMVERGVAQGIFSMWKTKEREKLFVYSNPIPVPNKLVLLAPKKLDIIFKTYDDLKQYTIGYVHGYAYPKDFKNSDLVKNKSYTDKEMVEKLISGLIDAAVIDELQAQYLLDRYFFDQKDSFKVINPPLAIFSQHLVISRRINNAENIIIEFNNGLDSILQDGTFDLILKKHGINPDYYKQ